MGIVRTAAAWHLVCAMAAMAALPPSDASAAAETDFHVKTTRDLIALCSTPPGDPMHTAAVHFCEGFLVGAYQYHTLSVQTEGRAPLVCPPNPPPSRDESVVRFIQWSKEHATALDAPPVAGMFEFLAQAFPCRN